MENLVPREFYDIDESGYWQRSGLTAGLLFGIGMGVTWFFLFPSTMGLGWRALLSILIGLGCGVGFGKHFPRRFRKKWNSMLDRLYAGDTEIDVPPPCEKDLRYRLPCSWKRSEHFAVGGVLYIGPHGFLFVPHKKNLQRDRSILEMGPSKSLQLSLTTPKLTGVFKLLVPRPPSLLQVVWPEGSAQFLVPVPSRLFKVIEERVREVV